MTDAINTGNFTAIDTETTGLSPLKCEIIEIGAVRFRNWKIDEKLDILIKPKSFIPHSITSLTGISERMVCNCPYFEDVVDDFMAFIGEDDIVGHNVRFDLNFLSHQGAPMYTSGFEVHDTLKIARKRLVKGIDIDNFSLTTLCEHYRIDVHHAHRATDDAAATGMLFGILQSY